MARPRALSASLPARGEADTKAPARPGGGRATAFCRYLSCIRYREILVLQGSPLLGAAFAMGRPDSGRVVPLLVFAAASVLLVAHVFVFNDWAGIDGDLNDANRVAGVFAAKGISRDEIRRLWIALLALSLLLFGLLGARPLAIASAIALLSFLYSLPARSAKGVPVLGSAVHLAGGSLHFLLGYALFATVDARALALSLFFGLVFAAGHLNQEVRDFDSDGPNGIRTNAVTFGKTATFFAGLLAFTFAYALLGALAVAGVIPRWLGCLALLYPLHVYWSSRAVAAGLGFQSICRLQARYRVLFAVIGLGMLAALLDSARSMPR